MKIAVKIKVYWPILILLFFIASFLFRTDLSFDQDLGRHLKLGGIILRSKTIPRTNLFSYTNPDFTFINTHWLFEVFVFLTNQAVGLQLILVLKLVIFLVSAWLVVKNVPKQNYPWLLPIGFIFAHVLRERLELRPEIFSFLFTVLTVYILNKYTENRTKLVFLLPLIQLIWINTHIYFFVGLVLQAIFLIHLVFNNLRSHTGSGNTKLLLIILITSVCVSLLNPNGLKGLTYPLTVNQNYGYTIVENQTMFLLEKIGFSEQNFLFVKLHTKWLIF